MAVGKARFLAGVYVWFFRGIPILVLLFLMYYGVFGMIEKYIQAWWGYRVNMSPFVAAVIVLGMTSTAYQSQIFRGAIGSLPQGQLKAANALGDERF